MPRRSKPKPRSLGSGVWAHPTRDGETIYIVYDYNKRTQRECIGRSVTAAEAGLPGPQSRNVTVEKARRLLKERRQEIRDCKRDNLLWVSPKDRQRQEQVEAARTDDRHEELRFENAVGRFLRECAGEYSRPSAVRNQLRLENGGPHDRPSALAVAFVGRFLDEITRVDIREYIKNRMGRTGTFRGWGEVSRRAPDLDVAQLSAVYTFLQEDEGHAIDNPCHRPRTRRKDGPLAPYKRKRKPVIPSPAALRGLLVGTPRGKDRGRVTDHHRALIALCRWTSGRPESEPCQLTHGDVEPPKGDRWAVVTLRGRVRRRGRWTKTGEARRVPLHPEGWAALSAVMEPKPTRFEAEALEAWKRLPIFRKKGSDRPWDCSSYRGGWAALRRAAVEEYPEVEGMVLRDMRSVVETHLNRAHVPQVMVNRILGHTGGTSDVYFEPSDQDLENALLLLDSDRNRTPTRTLGQSDPATGK